MRGSLSTQHAYLYAITEVYVCYERKAGINAQLKCEARIHHTQFEYLNH